MEEMKRIESNAETVSFSNGEATYIIKKKDISELLPQLLTEKVYMDIKKELPKDFTEQECLEVASAVSDTYSATDSEYYGTMCWIEKRIKERKEHERIS